MVMEDVAEGGGPSASETRMPSLRILEGQQQRRSNMLLEGKMDVYEQIGGQKSDV